MADQAITIIKVNKLFNHMILESYNPGIPES